ncbi:glycosyltransferase family 25 protein [Ursidibacter arcticus]
MSNFIISLHYNNENRRSHIKKQFNDKNIPFEFFNAVTPDDSIKVAEQLGINLNNTYLTKNEIGCFLSHVSIWHKMVVENIDVVGVFEDDIYLSFDSHEYLKKYDWIPEDTHIIKLEKSLDRIKASKKVKIHNKNNNLFILNSPHLGTAGYIITNKGAKYLLEKIKNIFPIIPIDIIMFDLFLDDNKIYQMLPCLCIQDFILNPNKESLIPSLLEADRLIRYAIENEKRTLDKELINKTIFYKIKKELYRPIQQLNRFITENLKRKVIINIEKPSNR